MRKRHKTTIFIRIFVPLFVVMILQGAIFYASTVHGNILNTLNNNATAIMEERVATREHEIENKFTTQWANLTFYCNELNEIYNNYQKKGVSLYTNIDQKKNYLTDAYPTLYTMLRNNTVNGVFLILTNKEENEALGEEEQDYYGMCVRDYDLDSGYSDKEDLLVLRAPSSITSDLGCDLDSNWDALYKFSENKKNGEFFYKPLEAAYDNPGAMNDNLAYFSGVHRYGSNDQTVVSYSIPLIAEDGSIYGVMGVELTTSYLATLLPYSELQGKTNSAYMLVQYKKGEDTMDILASNGALVSLTFDQNSAIKWADIIEHDDGEIQYIIGKNNLAVCGSNATFSIYNNNTPFEDEIFALIGIVKEDSLFAVSREVRSSLLYVILIVLVLGSVSILLVSRWLTHPITTLSNSVQNSKTDMNSSLPHTEIVEIDHLIDAIEKQSKTIDQTKAQSEFFMMISHELRTPLNAILGYLNLDIEEHEKNEWNAEYVKRSKNAALQLSNIADEMLDYTKIAVGSLQLKESMFDLKAMVQRLNQIISLKADEKGINFAIQMKMIPYEYLIGDVLRIELVLQHLLDNAVKFTDKNGSVKGILSEEVLENNQIRLEFKCIDTGRGMDREFCEKICAPFNQRDKAYSRTHGGLGIGLYLSKYFIDAMDGSFQVESEIGKGSCFTITMLLKQPDSQQLINNEVSYEHVRAMVVGPIEEDNSKLKDLLKRLKIKCDLFTDMTKALKRLKARKNDTYAYSLCIIDENMLRTDESFTEKLMEIDSNLKIFVYADKIGMISKLVSNPAISKIIYKPIFQSSLYDAIIKSFEKYERVEKQEIIEKFSGIHAMIVEDNPINADILTHFLQKLGVSASTFENGQLAVEEIENSSADSYQIIFMDIEMPIMNGYEATYAIRHMDKPEVKKIPIVAVSANAFDSDVEKSINVGMNKHLAKPVDIRKLSDTIKEYCVK